MLNISFNIRAKACYRHFSTKPLVVEMNYKRVSNTESDSRFRRASSFRKTLIGLGKVLNKLLYLRVLTTAN